jgi:hypothetical protein
MIYLDALDGEDILAGSKYSWHYGSKFVFEVWKRLRRPALMEMSTFHHHLWYVRSRSGAWDHPNRSHKKFIDIHCENNDFSRRMFLPAHLGWWALKGWTGAQGEPTFNDDIEYLMCKCIGTDTGFSVMGINPQSFAKSPALARHAALIKRYEDLRHSGKVPEDIKAKLRVPGDEFRLIGGLGGQWRFQPVDYAKHKFDATDERTAAWTSRNRFARQPLRLRIEALMSAAPYDAPGAAVLADFAAADFPTRACRPKVTAELAPSTAQVKASSTSGCYQATNAGAEPTGAWTKAQKEFTKPLNLGRNQALGLWVYGDGQGELLNLQLQSPPSVSHGIGDHYIPIDFTGWRYFQLIEPEGGRHADYAWPYGGIYSIYRESVAFSKLATLGLWYNNLPQGKKVSCYLSPIKALPLVNTTLARPSVSVGGKTVVFPTEIASGQYLEYLSPSDCKLYGPQGELLAEVTPQGDTPLVEPGDNRLQFQTGSPKGTTARAQITVISEGE